MLLFKGLGAFVGAVLGLVAIGLGLCAAATAFLSWRIGARLPPLGRFVDVDGGRLAVVETGARDAGRGTVVLLHGASANSADPMEGVGRGLVAAGFHVVALDRPGLGWSDRLEGAAMATPAAQGHAVAQALTRMGIGPAILLGHSWGGALAAAIALDHPERVSGLVLAAPVAMPLPAMGPLPWFYRLALVPPVTWLLSRTVGTPLGLSYLPGAGAVVFRPQAVPADYLARSRAELVLRPGAMLANVQDLVGLPAALAAQSPRYGTIRTPTTIVAGEADGIVPAERHARPLAAAIPGARLVLLPGVGHMVQYVAAEALVTEVARLADTIREARAVLR